MDGSLRLIDDPGASFSFQFGDACRHTITKPWLLPALPLILAKRYAQHRKSLKMSVSNLVRHLILIDSEVLEEDDLEEFGSLLSELENDVVVNIGSSNDFKSTISLLSRVNSGLSSGEWNSYLEDMLTSLIRTQRPSSFIFVGKYPYAGITGMLRRVGKSSRTLWIPVRATEDALLSRSERFGSVASKDTWGRIVNTSPISHSKVHIHEKFSGEYKKTLANSGLELVGLADDCGIIVLPSNELTNMWPLLEGKIVITIGECTNFLMGLPEFLRSKNVHLNSASPTEILRIVERIRTSSMHAGNIDGSPGWRRKELFQSTVNSALTGL